MNRQELLIILQEETGSFEIQSRLRDDVLDAMEKVQNEAINYSRCCTQLTDAEKEKFIDDAYWLNLQNLSGREDFEQAFKLGIETGVNETLEKLQI